MGAKPSWPRGNSYDRVIGAVLRETREAHGMSQRDVAEQLPDLTDSMVGFYERGDSRVTVAAFMQISSRVFRRHPHELMQEIELRLIDQIGDVYWN